MQFCKPTLTILKPMNQPNPTQPIKTRLGRDVPRQDLVVWDLVNESGLARLKGHVDAVTAVTFWEAPSSRRPSEHRGGTGEVWSGKQGGGGGDAGSRAEEVGRRLVFWIRTFGFHMCSPTLRTKPAGSVSRVQKPPGLSRLLTE